MAAAPAGLAQSVAPFKMLPSDLVFSGTDSAGSASLTANENERILFRDDATADTATIVNNSGGSTAFTDRSTAGSAFLTANEGSAIDFTGTATSAGANITVNGGGSLGFADDASAGATAITANGSVVLGDRSNAGDASIIVNEGGALKFRDEASARRAWVALNGGMSFSDFATAGDASIVVNATGALAFTGAAKAGRLALTNSGSTSFADQTSAENASLLNNATGTIAFAGSSTAGDAFVANSGSVTFAEGASAGTAELVNNATGRMRFDDAATLASASLTSAGVVIFAGQATAGSGTIVTGPTGTTLFTGQASGGTASLVTDAGGTTDFSGIGTGSVSVGSLEGPGSVLLGAAQLVIGGNGRSTTIDGIIADGGASGGTGGSLVKVGTGTLTLAGASLYTGSTDVREGTLQAGRAGAFAAASPLSVAPGARLDLAGFDQVVGGLSGAGEIDLAFGRLTVAGGGAFSGTIGGTGGLTKLGPSRLLLSGLSSYTGETRVEAGELAVTGSIASSPVTVAALGTLTGTGTVGTTVVDGQLSRSSDGATLSIAGDLTLSRTAAFAVTLDGTAGAALVAASGTATLGGTLIVSPAGSFRLGGAPVDLVSAAAIAGVFDAVASTAPLLDFVLADAGGMLTIEGRRSALALADLAPTGDAAAASAALESTGVGSALDAILVLPDEATIRTALANLSGSLHATLAGLLLDAGPGLLKLRPDADTLSEEGFALWAAPQAGGAGLDDGSGMTADLAGGGLSAGADFGFGAWTATIATGLAASTLDQGSDAATIRTAGLAAGVSGPAGPAALRLDAELAWHSIDTAREVALGKDRSRLDAGYGARSAAIEAELAIPLELGPARLTPFVAGGIGLLDTDGFLERGGPAGLRSEGETLTRAHSVVGIRGAREMLLPGGTSLSLQGSIAWRHAFTEAPALGLSFAGGPEFFVGGIAVPADQVALGADATWRFSPSASLGLSVTGVFAERYEGLRAAARVRMVF